MYLYDSSLRVLYSEYEYESGLPVILTRTLIRWRRSDLIIIDPLTVALLYRVPYLATYSTRLGRAETTP